MKKILFILFILFSLTLQANQDKNVKVRDFVQRMQNKNEMNFNSVGGIIQNKNLTLEKKEKEIDLKVEELKKWVKSENKKERIFKKEQETKFLTQLETNSKGIMKGILYLNEASNNLDLKMLDKAEKSFDSAVDSSARQEFKKMINMNREIINDALKLAEKSEKMAKESEKMANKYKY